MHEAHRVNCNTKNRNNKRSKCETWYESQLIGNSVHFYVVYQLIKSLLNGKLIRFKIRQSRFCAVERGRGKIEKKINRSESEQCLDEWMSECTVAYFLSFFLFLSFLCLATENRKRLLRILILYYLFLCWF